MKKSSLDISTNFDAGTVSLFRDFVGAAGDIPWLMVGATARDAILHHAYGLPIQRATTDIDLGVQLGSWDAYEKLKARLLQSNRFNSTGMQHREMHVAGLPLDIIPFGGLASANGRIKWPKERLVEMNVTGYDDILRAAVFVRIATKPDLVIPVASPAGITILKILAWSDNPSGRGKDAVDLAHIIQNYLDLDNWDRLSNEDSDLTNVDEFNVRFAGAELLGRDIAKISSRVTLLGVSTVLQNEIEQGELSRIVISMSNSTVMRSPTDFLALLEALLRGIRGGAVSGGENVS